MTDWLDEAEAACEAANRLKHPGEYNATMANIARTVLPRAIRALRAADTLTKAVDLTIASTTSNYGARRKLLSKALAAYRKARHD